MTSKGGTISDKYGPSMRGESFQALSEIPGVDTEQLDRLWEGGVNPVMASCKWHGSECQWWAVYADPRSEVQSKDSDPIPSRCPKCGEPRIVTEINGQVLNIQPR